MDKGDGHGAFADGGGTALYRAVAHVASREQSGDIRFQIIRAAIERPVGRGVAAIKQIRPGDKIAGLIANNSSFRSPIGVRRASDANKKLTSLNRFLLSGFAIS